MSMSNWSPILDGELAESARSCVRDIADVLVTSTSVWPEDATLFWAYAAAHNESFSEHYDAALAALVERMDGGYDGLALHHGLTGAGWVLAHVSEGAEQILEMIDEHLLEVLRSQTWSDQGEFDLIIGLAGFCVYFLERLQSSAAPDRARQALDDLVRNLRARAEPTKHGTCWRSLPGAISAAERERWPDGYYNCGVAHGLPGVVAVLGRIAATPGVSSDARTLCQESIRWLRHQRLETYPRFPQFVGLDGAPFGRPGLAWCYGNPGIAAAVWNACARIAEPIDEWLELALEAAAHPVVAGEIENPGLCHGAIGIAHQLNRFYQASGVDEFRTAARAWFDYGLRMRRDGEGLAGFVVKARIRLPWEPEADFIEGVVGIALALLAGLGSDEPNWDRRLGCDIPTMAR